MNYRTLVKGALALSLSLIVGSALASTTTYNDSQKYGATFESTAAGVNNDFDYALGSGITNRAYRLPVAPSEPTYGWFSGDPEQDESKIVARTDAAGGQALQLNTDASTLTNKFGSTLAGDLNDGIAANGAYFETEVKFVPSDTLDAGITGGQDATKFAIYAYANEEVEPPVTNLVVFHAYYNQNDDEIDYTNEVFTSVDIDANVYTKLRIEMKQVLNPATAQPVNVFAVKVNDGEALTSDLAFSESIWFLTVEDTDGSVNEVPNTNVSSLNFKGTGEIDNIKAGVVEATTTYAIDWTGSQNVVVSNATAELTVADTNFTAGAVLTFYPTVGSITNVNGVAQNPALASWEYTVGSADTNLVVLAGVEPVTPTGFAEGDTYGSVTLTAAQAAWLNTFNNYDAIDAALKTDASGLEKAYLLNVDPLTGDGTLTVTAITVGTDVQVSVALTRTGKNAQAINGTLKLFGTADLATAFAELSSATISDADFSEGDTATATFSGTGAKFFKAVIE